MRLRTVAVSALLVLGAGLAATACSSSDDAPASTEVEMPDDLEIGVATPASEGPKAAPAEAGEGAGS
jgi:hypothetical protein